MTATISPGIKLVWHSLVQTARAEQKSKPGLESKTCTLSFVFARSTNMRQSTQELHGVQIRRVSLDRVVPVTSDCIKELLLIPNCFLVAVAALRVP